MPCSSREDTSTTTTRESESSTPVKAAVTRTPDGRLRTSPFNNRWNLGLVRSDPDPWLGGDGRCPPSTTQLLRASMVWKSPVAACSRSSARLKPDWRIGRGYGPAYVVRGCISGFLHRWQIVPPAFAERVRAVQSVPLVPTASQFALRRAAGLLKLGANSELALMGSAPECITASANALPISVERSLPGLSGAAVPRTN
jgi:hypothetical protein